MKRLLKSHIALLAWRLALLYAVLAICRAIFWRYNYAGIGPLADAELPALARGALLFDTVSVLYANALLIVLSLIPLHLRERRWWQRMLYFYYVVVNALLVVAVNLGDAVYFRYTQKRFTAEEIFFADNDNSLQLVGKFMAENIPLLLAGIGLIALLALAGGRKAHPEPLCRRPLCYYGGGTVLLVVAALLSVAGGGHAHDAPRHALQRHALRLRQRPRQPDPLEPLLHPAHRGVGRKDQLRTLLRSGRTGRYLHARPPSRLGRRGTARRTQRGGLRHGEHVGRTLGPPPSRTLRRPAGQGLHAVSGFAHAGGLLLRTHVRQRHPFDSGAARRTGIDPLVQDPLRADAAGARTDAAAAAYPARQGLRHRLFLRLGGRLDGFRRLCGAGRRTGLL